MRRLGQPAHQLMSQRGGGRPTRCCAPLQRSREEPWLLRPEEVAQINAASPCLCRWPRSVRSCWHARLAGGAFERRAITCCCGRNSTAMCSSWRARRRRADQRPEPDIAGDRGTWIDGTYVASAVGWVVARRTGAIDPGVAGVGWVVARRTGAIDPGVAGRGVGDGDMESAQDPPLQRRRHAGEGLVPSRRPLDAPESRAAPICDSTSRYSARSASRDGQCVTRCGPG